MNLARKPALLIRIAELNALVLLAILTRKTLTRVVRLWKPFKLTIFKTSRDVSEITADVNSYVLGMAPPQVANV